MSLSAADLRALPALRTAAAEAGDLRMVAIIDVASAGLDILADPDPVHLGALAEQYDLLREEGFTLSEAETAVEEALQDARSAE